MALEIGTIGRTHFSDEEARALRAAKYNGTYSGPQSVLDALVLEGYLKLTEPDDKSRVLLTEDGESAYLLVWHNNFKLGAGQPK